MCEAAECVCVAVEVVSFVDSEDWNEARGTEDLKICDAQSQWMETATHSTCGH